MTDYNNVFNSDNIPESNWFKFENVGDKIAGEVVGLEHKDANGQLPAQRVFTLKTANGVVNVGISMTKDYIIQRTNMVKLGDIVGFDFKESIPAKVKGYSPAKSIEVYVTKGSAQEGTSLGDTTSEESPF